MMKQQQKNKWTFKDKLEIAEAIFTIVVSIMAIWGTLVAWENGFWHKLERITNKIHQELVHEKGIKTTDNKTLELIEKTNQVNKHLK